MASLLRQQASRTLARRELAQRHDNLEEISSQVGSLDERALGDFISTDPDAGVEILVDLARATDPALRAQARAVAARVLLPLARHGGDLRASGTSRLVTVAGDGADLDVDATVKALAEQPWLGGDALHWRRWRQSNRAYVLVIDASGSVAGKPLATAIVTAAAVASQMKANDELSVIAFWSRQVVLRDLRSPTLPIKVLESLFDLRGGDTTDLAGGVRAALAQAVLARASRREVLILTDGLADEGNDFVAVAATAASVGARVHVLSLGEDCTTEADIGPGAPSDDRGDCGDSGANASARLAAAGGGRVIALRRPSDAAAAVAVVLEDR